MGTYAYDDMLATVHGGRLPGVVAIYDKDGDLATLTASVDLKKVWRWANSADQTERVVMAIGIVKIAREHALAHGATLR